MKKLLILLGILVVLFSCSTKNQEPAKDEATLKQDAKMEWWREARFGMFIHWGVYSVPAGEWDGKEVPGLGEWIMNRAKIPVAEYEKLAGQFNPVKFNAEEWVKIAKNAGMKYIVITSKHHDGFAMYQSKASTYNIVDATPFDRDPLKELSEACKKENIKLGFYYSQAQDWHEPGGLFAGISRGTHFWDSTFQRAPLMDYINGKALPQVKEILENYGEISVLWWDTPEGMTLEAAQTLKDYIDKYPNLIANNRLYQDWKGDFSTPENYIPPTGLDYDWETCMTMNNTWGFKKMDSNWKSTETLIRNLVDIASKGGNFLLNVGPTSEGLIPEASVERLGEMGSWMQKNSEAIYGTSASAFFKLPWGRCTTKKDKNSHTLYLHVFDWPADGIIRVPGIDAKIKEIYLLADHKQKVTSEFENGDLLIQAPGLTPDPINTVIVVKTGKDMKITSNQPALKDGVVLLPAEFADISNGGNGAQAILSGEGDNSVITNWASTRTRLEWVFIGEPGKYKVVANMKVIQPCKLSVRLGESNLTSELSQSAGDEFQKIELGEVEVKNAGNQSITFRPYTERGQGAPFGPNMNTTWGNVELKSVTLVKI